MSKSKRIYSYDEDIKAVGFMDVLGFANLTTASSGEDATLAISFFENAILPYRDSMLRARPREVPTNLEERDFNFKTENVWHKEIPIGAVNFVYASDCGFFYSNSLSHIFDLFSAIFGAAIVFGVPLRAGIALGGVHHSEWNERPGLGVTLFGSGITRAVGMEKSKKGSGMRIWLHEDVVKLADKLNLGKKIVVANGTDPAELKWWLGAVSPTGERKVESDELEYRFSRWFSEKYIKNWFKGDNCESTKTVVAKGVAELRSMRN